MKTYIVYRSNTEYERDVIQFLREFERQTGHQLERIDPDTRDGATKCNVYDIVEYPSVIALNAEGALQSVWRGLPLPLISEVSYYAE